MLFNILKCSVLDKWLLQSTWGKKRPNLPVNKELSRLSNWRTSLE